MTKLCKDCENFKPFSKGLSSIGRWGTCKSTKVGRYITSKDSICDKEELE